jgi:hypothetical protein
VAALDVHWELTGARDPQGNPRPDRQGLLNFVMAKNAGEWQIMVMHNLDLTALPPSNSLNSATTKPWTRAHCPSSSADSEMIREQESRKNLPLSLYFVSELRSETTFAKRQTRLYVDPPVTREP